MILNNASQCVSGEMFKAITEFLFLFRNHYKLNNMIGKKTYFFVTATRVLFQILRVYSINICSYKISLKLYIYH